ncbi:MAG: S8 family serine peptidase [Acidobacteria bacterium]|nr:S8 family serine peptidase [Acidobacteriota bacterium]
MRRALACLALSLALAPAAAAATPALDRRIHPALRDASTTGLAPSRAPFAPGERPGRALLRVRTTDPEAFRSEAERIGAEVRAIVGGIASVEADLGALDALAAAPGVVSIKPARSYRPVLDVSTAEMGADATAAAYGGTGKGVIVAVIDSGIDFRRMDFRNADGTTRLLDAWDQTDSIGAGSGCGAGYTFGRCFPKVDLDADLFGGAPVTLSDGFGHGTHVAGIAAGNGLSTANGVPAGTYAGVAPDADLIIVKVFTSAGFFNGDLTTAYAWIRDRAAAAGKPFVINMSLGGDYGAHDGTDPDEISLDAILAAPNKGRAAAIASGNSRGRAIHAEATASVGVALDHPFVIPPYTPAGGSNNDEIDFDLWYEGGDNLTVSLVDSGGTVLATAARGAKAGPICTTSGQVTIDARNTTDPDNHDSEVEIFLLDSSACAPVVAPPSGATMKIRVTGVGVPQGGHYHVWNVASLGNSFANVTFSPANETSICAMPATSLYATTAGSYITRSCWPNADPNNPTTCRALSGVLSGISGFSGNGPTRDGRLKPDVSAPGEWIVSTLSSLISASPQIKSFDGLHWGLRGTSMASPHVAGALAVLLQFNPGLTAAQARDRLSLNARSDAFTGAVPNQLYGGGKIDLLGAANDVVKPVVGVTVAAGGALAWSAEPHSSTYNVYRGGIPGSMPSSYGTCLASGLPSPAFTDAANPAPGSAFLYLVTGVKAGIEGALGFDSANRQRPNIAPCP